ncbi:serine/threonine-protein kinase [Arthrobacter halodurans]|uniref:non-specific serine/threonine protein kinase n=1 Tax=Arthrobacter halodurans TaxID=516699 RepID=A0ABV4URI8_9MICC
MSRQRPPAPPPAIAGYEYLGLLGTGGFSDVYLYEQDRPRRKVAVKVLLSDLRTQGARRRFESEANLMAQLSSHPYIVTIYEANVTTEGHSYLAMEYCSRPSLDVRYRRGRLGVDEVLSVGIQVASAVETAHRAGIVHRDIKPANILVTDYNRPALTDFGISGTTDTLDDDAGLSIPWSPPEAFAGGSPDGVRMDVWSLGATLYTLLAGSSPFVRPGADNSQRELIGRIAGAPLRPLNRADVPAALERTLATALSKEPGARFESARQLALSLQRVQADLGLSVTPFEVLDDAGLPEGAREADGEATRVRRVVSIDPAGPAGTDDGATVVRGSLPGGTQPGGGPRASEAPAPAPEQRWLPPASPAPAPSGSGGTQPRQRFPTALVAGAGAAVAVVAVGVAVAGALANGRAATDGPDARSGAPISQGPADALVGDEGIVPAAAGFAATASGGTVVFTWENPEPRDGDVYYWAPVTATDQGESRKVGAARARTPRVEGQPTCIQVLVVRANGKASDPARHCAGG